MAAIRKLSQEIIGRIAAGEVVERPASVVKEMVENAIDAGATHITVEVRGGGVEYLRITDDGKGIPAEEIRMAFERHATSKLQTADQLFDIHTLGFRGEALASVAAVAKVTCTTKLPMHPLASGPKSKAGSLWTSVRQLRLWAPLLWWRICSTIRMFAVSFSKNRRRKPRWFLITFCA